MNSWWRPFGFIILVLAAGNLAAQMMPFGFWKKPEIGGGGGSGLYGTALAGYQYTCFDGDIYALAKPSADRIVAGGNFTIAAPCTGKGVPVSLSSGNVTAGWSYPGNRIAGGEVFASVPDGIGGWYISGNFRSVGGVARSGLAHINSSGQLDLTFNPTLTAVNITTLEKIGSRIFIGGFNSQTSPEYGTPIDENGFLGTSTEAVEAGLINGAVKVVISDGGTGWYIGGFFTSLQGQPISYLARVDAQGKVDPTFNLSLNGSVQALKLIGNTLYLGGFFTQVAGLTRYSLASVSTVTGLVTTWNPSVTGGLYSIVEDGLGNMLIGGRVSSVGGSNMGSNASFFDKDSGTLLNFPFIGTANSSGAIYAAESDGAGGYYLGGEFTTAGTFAVNNIAHLQSDGTVNPNFRPNVQFGAVFSILKHGGTIFIGGSFSDVESAGCFGFCGLNATNGAVLPTPRANTINIPLVYDLAINGGTIFIGGFFTGINGTSRNNLAAMSMTSNTPLAWNPRPNNSVTNLAYTSGTLYAVGNFGSLGGAFRNRFAALDPVSGNALALNPNVTGAIGSVLVSGGTLFIGGSFTEVDGISRPGLAALNITTGTAFLSFNPNLSGYVYELAKNGDQLLAVGDITSVGGTELGNFASVSASTGTLNSLRLSFNATVRAVDTFGTTMAVGGIFEATNGFIRKNAASVNLSTGSTGTWNPNPDDQVNAILVSGTMAYLAGEFLNVGGQARRCLAAAELSQGTVLSWNPAITGSCSMEEFEFSGSHLFAAGFMGTVGGLPRQGVAQLDLVTGTPTTWNANILGSVYGFKVVGSNLYLGGFFSSVGGQSRNNAARVSVSDGSVGPWNPGPNSSIDTIASNGSGLYIGGNFDFFSSASTKLIALNSVTGAREVFPSGLTSTVTALKANGATLFVGSNSTLLSLDSSSGGTLASVSIGGNRINDILVTLGSVFIGGDFFSVGGQSRNHLAAIVRSAGTTAAWAPAVSAEVRTLDLGTNSLFIGGDFVTAGGASRNRIAELSLTTGLATPWNPNASGTVRRLIATGSSVIVGGDFTSIGGSTQKFAAEVQISNGSLTVWNPLVTGAIFSLASDGSNLYLGGTLSGANGVIRNRLAALDSNTGQLTDWNPNSNGAVSALATLGVDLLVGGSFGTIGGASRSRLAILNGSTGAATSWTTNVTGGTLNGAQVRALLVNGTLAYVAGTYGTIASVVRANLAAVSIATGTVTTFSLATNGTAFKSLAFNQGTLWIGGTYGTLAGQVRRGLAAVTVAGAGAIVASFNPAVDTSNIDYRSLLYSNGSLYIGGSYFDISTSTGSTRPKISNVNANSGALGTLFDNDFTVDTVNGIGLGNNNVYTVVSGYGANSQGRAYSTLGFAQNSWMASNGNTGNLNTLLVDGTNVYVGGESHRSNTLPRFQLNRVDGTTGNPNW